MKEKQRMQDHPLGRNRMEESLQWKSKMEGIPLAGTNQEKDQLKVNRMEEVSQAKASPDGNHLGRTED